MTTLKVLRYADLHEAGIVSGRTQLRRLIENHNFPPGYLLGPNTRVWDHDAVEEWLSGRRGDGAAAQGTDAEAVVGQGA